MKPKKCDCWIGIIYEYGHDIELNISNYANLIKLYIEDSTWSWAEKPSPKDYLDRRKGWTNMFNYCPICGKKINWVKLRKALKEEK